MQTILITGGTGLVGKALTKMLIEKNYKVIVLTRSLRDKINSPELSYALWDVDKQTIDMEAISKADGIIHLAGAGVVDKKWTSTYKKEILSSRTRSSLLLVDALKKGNHQVKTIVSSSAIGWYGPDKKTDYAFVETDTADIDFLGTTCRQWEESITTAEIMGIRVCKLRTGIVLSNYGGALVEFKKPLLMGIAAILGNGKQMISWIHVEDLCRMFIHAIENPKLTGSFNAVSPKPVSNKTLTLTLAKLIRGKFYIPMHVPAFILKLMLGESSIEVLKSTTVSSEKIKSTGFTFYYPSIEAALKDLTSPSSK
ncbi:MAG: TIGR01777 family oxidoreductase [Sphingobacteriales bacterium]|nr:TIGR01777 family oxidoreductase [Sphingobacteriales bacterium]